ncbi:hypothetical protein C9890_0351 [Perkinsus sp. BL_2016]|nr:hypothetical protein C9890_0351 [Perkinsus sp. BL_2016]
MQKFITFPVANNDCPDWASIGTLITRRFCLLQNHEVSLSPLSISAPDFSNCLASFKAHNSEGICFHVKVVPKDDFDSQNFPAFIEKYPELCFSRFILVPIIVEVISEESGLKLGYVHLTPWEERATDMAAYITRLWVDSKKSQVFELLRNFGQFIGNFQSTFPKVMHNDLNPQNVLVLDSEDSGGFVLIDCAGIDDEVGDDLKNFVSCLEVMELGPDFFELGTKSFLEGYYSI